MKKSSLKRQNRKRTTCCKTLADFDFICADYTGTHLIRVVQMQNPTATSFHLLMTLPTGRQTCKHVDIVARKVQADQSLKND